jgi:hypothetical protein
MQVLFQAGFSVPWFGANQYLCVWYRWTSAVDF